MNANNFWQVFLDTGSPEMYLLFNKVRKMEEADVLDGTGVGFENNSLQ